jgi:hypothetical protein
MNQDDRTIETEMDEAFQEISMYRQRTLNWMLSNNDSIPNSGFYECCTNLLRFGSTNPIDISNITVSSILQEENGVVYPGSFATISYEINEMGVFHECVSPKCLSDVIHLLIQTKNETQGNPNPEISQQADDAIKAIRNLRQLYCEHSEMPEPTEGLCADSPRAFAYALSVVRQIVLHQRYPEMKDLYTNEDLEEMYQYGFHTLGYLVSDPNMVSGIDYVAPQVPEYNMDVCKHLLRWTSFLCEEIHATQ